MKKTINTKKAPSPIGPYSQAISHNNLLFISGQIAIDPVSGALDSKDIKTETERVMKNLESILNEAGSDFTSVIKTTIFLKNMNDFPVVNQTYGSFFIDGNYPARETIEVSRLPKDVNVEISMIAAV